MLDHILRGHVQFLDQVSSWEEAIRCSAEPLLGDGIISEHYIEAMIQSVNVNGAYMVILPEIAIPHARPEMGVLKQGLSFLRLDTPTVFPGGKDVKLLMTIASDSDDGHLEMLGALGSALTDDDIVSQLMTADTEKEVLNIFCSIEE